MAVPFVIGFIIPLVVYDGIRHFLWTIPYFCIIPGLTIYYLINNLNLMKFKFVLIFLSAFVFYFLFNFFLTTPYQYTYLNLFNGKVENKYKKFENDYWGLSANELVKYYSFDKEKSIKLAICGVHPRIFDYFKKKGNTNLERTDPEKADYIIMTNRATHVSGKLTNESTNKTVKILNCFDKFKGEDVFKIERGGLILSVIRKKTNISNWN